MPRERSQHRKSKPRREIQKIEVTIIHEEGNPDFQIDMDFKPRMIRTIDKEHKHMSEARKGLQGMAAYIADAIVKTLNE